MRKQYQLQLLNDHADAFTEAACRAADAAEEAAVMLDFATAQDELKYARACAKDALECARSAKGTPEEDAANGYASEAIQAVKRAKLAIKSAKGRF